MNCEDFENSVNDLAREQMMDAVVRARALVHRDECPGCAQRLANENALSFKLRALAADARSAAVPTLGSEVLTAMREHQAQIAAGTSDVPSRFRPIAVAATATAAAAALVLVVLAFAFMRSATPEPTAQSRNDADNPPRQASGKPTPLVAGPSPTLPVNSPNGPIPRRVARRNTKRGLTRGAALAKAAAGNGRKGVVTAEPATSVTASYSVEVSTDFFPVGYGSGPNLGDGGQLVRVELPRSALVAFGVPMNVNRYDEKVKAEVLFGADGMAHAIRFVQ